MKQGELHLQLEILANDFRQNMDEKTGEKILSAFVQIIRNNESILIDGIPSPINPDIIVPSGYYAKDGRFYFHIFSSRQSLEASSASNGILTHMDGLMKLMEDNPQVGGFSLNQRANEGTILLTREDIDEQLRKED